MNATQTAPISFDAFSARVEIGDEYLSLKYGSAKKKDWLNLAEKARSAVISIRKEKSSKISNSRWDMLDQWQRILEAVFANSELAAAKCLN